MIHVHASSNSMATTPGRQEAMEVESPEYLYGREEPGVAMLSSGESAMALGTTSQALSWPWLGGGQFTSSFYTAFDTQSFRAPTTPWPCSSSHYGEWAIPYPPVTFSPLVNTVVCVGVWPYPSVQDMGYNSVPLRPLPFGDYAMPLGDQLTPAMQERYGRIIR